MAYSTSLDRRAEVWQRRHAAVRGEDEGGRAACGAVGTSRLRHTLWTCAHRVEMGAASGVASGGVLGVVSGAVRARSPVSVGLGQPLDDAHRVEDGCEQQRPPHEQKFTHLGAALGAAAQMRWRSYGDRMEITWRARGGRMEGVWRSHLGAALRSQSPLANHRQQRRQSAQQACGRLRVPRRL